MIIGPFFWENRCLQVRQPKLGKTLRHKAILPFSMVIHNPFRWRDLWAESCSGIRDLTRSNTDVSHQFKNVSHSLVPRPGAFPVLAGADTLSLLSVSFEPSRQTDTVFL